MVSLKACDVLPPLQNLVNSIYYPGEVIHIKSKLQELEAEFKAKLFSEYFVPDNYEEDEIAKGYLPRDFPEVKIPKYI